MIKPIKLDLCKICTDRHCNGCKDYSNYKFSIWGGLPRLDPAEIIYPETRNRSDKIYNPMCDNCTNRHCNSCSFDNKKKSQNESMEDKSMLYPAGKERSISKETPQNESDKKPYRSVLVLCYLCGYMKNTFNSALEMRGRTVLYCPSCKDYRTFFRSDLYESKYGKKR